MGESYINNEGLEAFQASFSKCSADVVVRKNPTVKIFPFIAANATYTTNRTYNTILAILAFFFTSFFGILVVGTTLSGCPSHISHRRG